MHTLIYRLKKLANELKNQNVEINTIRVFLKEKLQVHVLDFIYNHPTYKNIVFYGGSCLRKIFDLNRISEDLDFENPNKIDLTNFPKDLELYFKQNMQFETVDIIKQKGQVLRYTLRFPILKDVGLSGYTDEKLHVKIEINNQQTNIYSTEVSMYTEQEYSILIKHYDLPTLMAGKILACLTRNYKKGETNVQIKGRDFYDLIWYMSKNIQPNEQKLKDENPEYDSKNIFFHLEQKVKTITPSDLLMDLRPFFTEKIFIQDWCENFHALFAKYKKPYLEK